MAKRAVCIGIEQFQGSAVPRLKGCVYDARSTARLLEDRFGFTEVKDLFNERATKENVLRAIDWLAIHSAPGDVAVISLASYGSWYPDRSGHDADGLDEIFVVYDHSWQWTLLRDDELAQAFGRFPPAATVVCLLDTAHAGASTAGRFLAPPVDVTAVAGALSRRLPIKPRLRHRRADDLPNCVVMAACAEREVAAETSLSGGHAGVFTLALLEALGALGPAATWAQVHAHMVKNLQARGFQQTPQLHAADAMRNQTVFAEGGVPASPAWGAGAAVPPPSVGWGTAPQAQSGGLPGAPGSDVVTVAWPINPGWAAPKAPASMVALADNGVVTPVDAALGQFKPDDYTVQLCNTVLRVLPFMQPRAPYGRLVDALKAIHPQASGQMLARAQEHATSEQVSKALWVASAIDTGDAGIAVFSGLKSALDLFRGKRGDAFETDTQQAVDAALKLLAMGYIVYRLFPGPVPQRIQTFYSLPAGQSLSAYYASIEVALPFADNAMVAGGHFLSTLWQRYGSQAADKLSSLVGPDDAKGAQGILGTMMGHMEGVVQRVTPFARQVADAANRYVPTALNVADKVAGVVATAADAMPVYRYLGATLAAEAAAKVGIRGQ